MQRRGDELKLALTMPVDNVDVSNALRGCSPEPGMVASDVKLALNRVESGLICVPLRVRGFTAAGIV